MTEPRVYFRHARMIQRPGGRPLCVDGIEAWCNRYGIAVEDLIHDGIPGERLIEIGDANAMKALAFARAEVIDGQQ